MQNHVQKILTTTMTGDGDSDQLLAAIFGICMTTRGKNFLELGVREGVSTLPLLTAASLLNARLTSVDICETIFDCPPDLKTSWTFVKSDAIEFLSNNTSSYDLVFIDDWHDGVHVRKELDLLEPYCSKSTIILLHDLMARTHPNYNTDFGDGEFGNGGPFAAVNGLDTSVWEFATIPVCNGLTLLRKKQ
jgi:predicted O-methyltransferase YrrM